MAAKKTDQIEPGEVLAADLTTPQGAIMVKAGTTIEEKHLRLFKMWGVDSVQVRGRGPEGDGGGEAAEELLDEVEADIKGRFAESLDNEVMAEILRVAVTQRAAKMAAAEGDDNG